MLFSLGGLPCLLPRCVTGDKQVVVVASKAENERFPAAAVICNSDFKGSKTFKITVCMEKAPMPHHRCPLWGLSFTP